MNTMIGSGQETNPDDRLIEDLERELRMTDHPRMDGHPFVASEPDDRYWATLRLSIMEKIEAKEQRTNYPPSFAGFPVRIKAWITGRSLGVSLARAAAAVLVAVALTVQPTPTARVNQSVASRMTDHPRGLAVISVPSDPTPSAPIAQLAPESTTEASKPRREMSNHRSTPIARHLMASSISIPDAANPTVRTNDRSFNDQSTQDADLLGHADEVVAHPASSESEYPVSLNELSAPELESVLTNLQKPEDDRLSE